MPKNETTKDVFADNTLAADLAAQNVELRNASGGKLRGGINAVLDKLRAALAVATEAGSASLTAQQYNDKLADSLISLRMLFWFEGRPDYNGRTNAYQNAVTPLYAAYAEARGMDAKAVALNLQKLVSRRVRPYALAYAAEATGTELTEAQQAKVLSTFDASKRSNDATLAPVLAELRETLPTTTASLKASAERKRNRNTPTEQPETAEQTEQRESAETVRTFAQSVQALSLGDATDEILASLAVLAVATLGNASPSYGTKGKGHASQNARKIAALATLLDKIIEQGKLTDATDRILFGKLTGTEQQQPEQQPEQQQQNAPRKRSASQRKRIAARKRNATPRKRAAAARK